MKKFSMGKKMYFTAGIFHLFFLSPYSQCRFFKQKIPIHCGRGKNNGLQSDDVFTLPLPTLKEGCLKETALTIIQYAEFNHT